MSRHIPENSRFDARMRSGPKCPACGDDVEPPEFDHASVPYSVKPIHEAWNIQLLCRRCNQRKGASMADVFIDKDQLHEHQRVGLTALSTYGYTDPITKERRAALLWFATGSGKTWEALLVPFEMRKKKTLILAPGRKTVQRMAEDWPGLVGKVIFGKNLPKKLPVLCGSAPKSGARGHKADWSLALESSPVIVATVQYILNRIEGVRSGDIKRDWFAEFDLLVIDEGHHIAANSWSRVVEACKNADVIYMTGTPKRHDKELLPLVPFHDVKLESGLMMYTLRDVAEVTGRAGARFTLNDALRTRIIKAPRPTPVDALTSVVGSGEGPDGTTRIEADSIDGFAREAKSEGFAAAIYWQPAVIRAVLEKAWLCFRAMSTEFGHLGVKLTAIVKAQRIEHAKLIAGIANGVGWTAVAYYGEEPSETNDEESVADDLRERLIRFESPTDPTNLCVQVGTLTEGYNNPSICMVIPLCNMESMVEIEQFFGRGLRLIDQKAWERNPPMWIVYPNHGPLHARVSEYMRMTDDLSFKVGNTNGAGSDGQHEPLPWAQIESGDWFVEHEEEWRQIVEQRDPLDAIVDAMRTGDGKPIIDPVLRAFTKDLIRSGQLDAPGFVRKRDSGPPRDPGDAKRLWAERHDRIRRYMVTNAADLAPSFETRDWQALVGKAMNGTINKRWAGLRGGLGNRNLDQGQLYEFLACDIDALCDECLCTLRDMARRRR